MRALDVNRYTFSGLVVLSLVFAGAQALAEDGGGAIEFAEEAVDGFALFWFVLFVEVEDAVDGGGVGGNEFYDLEVGFEEL